MSTPLGSWSMLATSTMLSPALTRSPIARLTPLRPTRVPPRDGMCWASACVCVQYVSSNRTNLNLLALEFFLVQCEIFCSVLKGYFETYFALQNVTYVLPYLCCILFKGWWCAMRCSVFNEHTMRCAKGSIVSYRISQQILTK